MHEFYLVCRLVEGAIVHHQLLMHLRVIESLTDLHGGHQLLGVILMIVRTQEIGTIIIQNPRKNIKNLITNHIVKTHYCKQVYIFILYCDLVLLSRNVIHSNKVLIRCSFPQF